MTAAMATTPGGLRTRVGAAATILGEGAGVLVPMPLWFWWAVWRGGYPPSVWTGGLVYLALATVLLSRMLGLERPSGTRLVAIAVASGLWAWEALSILWAGDQGAAVHGAERTLVFLLAFVLAVLWPPSPRALRVAVAALPCIALLGGASALGGALGSPHSLVDGRLAGPTAYANASAALFIMGALPALVTATDSTRRPALRVVMLSLAGMLTALALLTQSRGVVAVGIATLAIALIGVVERFRLAIGTAFVASCVAVESSTLLAVRVAAHHGNPDPALRRAAFAILAIGLALAAIGTALVWLERAVRPEPRHVRRFSLVARAALALALVGGCCAFVATQGNPVAWAQARWKDFKTPDYRTLEAAPTRFGGSLGSNRYDYWRVAVAVAGERPLSGFGIDNFEAQYLRRRHTQKAPLYAHSIWFGALAELGVPGLLLLVAFVGATAALVARAWRSAPTSRRALVVAASVPAIALLVHSSADWVQVFPVLSVPALGLLGGAVSLAPGRRPAAPAGSALGFGVLAFALAVTLVALPVLVSERLQERAVAISGPHPSAAEHDLDLAADIDPLNAAPLIERGLVAVNAGRLGTARQAFSAAAGRDGSDWFTRFALALIDAREGRPRMARRELDAAVALNPRDAIVRSVRGPLARGEPTSVAQTLAAVLTEPA